jgi:hypothetical protein
MSPLGQNVKPLNNLYTVLLGVATIMTLITAGYVLYMCYVQYGSFLPPQ